LDSTNLPIPDELLGLLRQWRSVSPFNKPDGWVFASPYRKVLRSFWPAQLLKKHIKPVAIAAGLPSIGWHSSVSAWGKEKGAEAGGCENAPAVRGHRDHLERLRQLGYRCETEDSAAARCLCHQASENRRRDL
jgi:hypothetical protein